MIRRWACRGTTSRSICSGWTGSGRPTATVVGAGTAVTPIVARALDDRFLVIRSDFPAREKLLTAHPTTLSVPPRFERHRMVVADLRDGDPDVIRSTPDAAHALQGQ